MMRFGFVQCLKCGWTVMDGDQALISNMSPSSLFGSATAASFILEGRE